MRRFERMTKPLNVGKTFKMAVAASNSCLKITKYLLVLAACTGVASIGCATFADLKKK